MKSVCGNGRCCSRNFKNDESGVSLSDNRFSFCLFFSISLSFVFSCHSSCGKAFARESRSCYALDAVFFFSSVCLSVWLFFSFVYFCFFLSLFFFRFRVSFSFSLDGDAASLKVSLVVCSSSGRFFPLANFTFCHGMCLLSRGNTCVCISSFLVEEHFFSLSVLSFFFFSKKSSGKKLQKDRFFNFIV